MFQRASRTPARIARRVWKTMATTRATVLQATRAKTARLVSSPRLLQSYSTERRL